MAVGPVPASDLALVIQKKQKELSKYLTMLEMLLGPFPEGAPNFSRGGGENHVKMQAVEAILRAARFAADESFSWAGSCARDTLELEKALCKLQNPHLHEFDDHPRPKMRVVHYPCFTHEDYVELKREMGDEWKELSSDEMEKEYRRRRLEKRREEIKGQGRTG